MDTNIKHLIAIVGAGPAGLYAAKQLANPNTCVVIFNRDIKPGGLAEYGIYPDKHKMKEGLRQQFRQVLASPHVEYYGNVVVGQDGDITLDDLRGWGFQAILVAVGAQGTKWLGLPGEDLQGVYHAKDLVYYYNQLPPFSARTYALGKHVVIVGVGNVMADIARWLIRALKVDEVIAVARRGPAQVKFDKKEMEVIVKNLDRAALDAEIARVAPIMQAVGQDPDAAKAEILAALPHALAPISDTRFRLEFLASPARMLGAADGRVSGLEVENTTLIRTDGDTKARGLGTKRVIPCDTVVFAIGDRVDEQFGLPVKSGEFVKNPQPRFPVEGLSYEAFDPQSNAPLEGVFLAGWARQASTGLVGTARKDGVNAAKAIERYLQTVPSKDEIDLAPLQARFAQLGKAVVTNADIKRLEQVEKAEAARRGLEEFKFATNVEMLAAQSHALA